MTPLDPNHQARYHTAVRGVFTQPAFPDPLRGLGTLPPEEVLSDLEKEILNAADLGSGIDPVLILALDLPEPLAVPAYNRRIKQIVAESGEDTAEWVIGHTKAAHRTQTTIGKARLALLVALDQIEQSLTEADGALKELNDACDPQLIRGQAPIMLVQALGQIRLLTAGAAAFAPKLED